MVVIGGAEAHLVAAELAAAHVGVVLASLQSFRTSWDQRRALKGAPFTNGTAVDRLVAAGVTTAVGLEEDRLVRDMGLLAGIACANSGGHIGVSAALDLVSTNIYKMLGLKPAGHEDAGVFLVFEGSPLEIGGKVRAVADGSGTVDLY